MPRTQDKSRQLAINDLKADLNAVFVKTPVGRRCLRRLFRYFGCYTPNAGAEPVKAFHKQEVIREIACMSGSSSDSYMDYTALDRDNLTWKDIGKAIKQKLGI